MPQVQCVLQSPHRSRVCDRLALAQREHYKIGVYARCGGLEVYAKTKPRLGVCGVDRIAY